MHVQFIPSENAYQARVGSGKAGQTKAFYVSKYGDMDAARAAAEEWAKHHSPPAYERTGKPMPHNNQRHRRCVVHVEGHPQQRQHVAIPRDRDRRCQALPQRTQVLERGGGDQCSREAAHQGRPAAAACRSDPHRGGAPSRFRACGAAVKERQLLMSAPMVRATLRHFDPKTQTRRVLKTQPELGLAASLVHVDGETSPRLAHGQCLTRYSCPYGAPGDRLWVREAWRSGALTDRFSPAEMSPHVVWYDADGAAPSACDGRYRHARFMPRWASRITLEITGVRVEQLHDISEADVLAEGIQRWPLGFRVEVSGAPKHESRSFERAQDAYGWLWRSINPDRIPLLDRDGLKIGMQPNPARWGANPWVWVIEFKRLAT